MMQPKPHSRSNAHKQLSPEAPPPQPPYECEVCGVRFAKAAKRDVHLLDVHSAHFGLSPRALSPSATGGVGRTVSHAVSEANRAFAATAGPQRSSVVCALCPISTATFKNPRDLAQHILSKHSEDTFHSEASAVSCVMGPPPAKRAKLMPGIVKKGASPPPKSVKAQRKEPPVPAPSAMKPPLSPKGAASRGGSLSPRARSRSPPKKAVVANTSGKSPKKDQSCSQASAAADRLSVPMDFSAIIGFTSNAHKSYYRLPKR